MNGAPISPPLDPTQLLEQFNHYGSLVGAPTTHLLCAVPRLSVVTHKLRARMLWDARVQAELEFTAAPDDPAAAFLVAIAFGTIENGDAPLAQQAMTRLDRLAPQHAQSTEVLRALTEITARDATAARAAIDRARSLAVAKATTDALAALALAHVEDNHADAGALLAEHANSLALRGSTPEALSHELLARYALRTQNTAVWQSATEALAIIAPMDTQLAIERARVHLSQLDGYAAAAVLDVYVAAGGALTAPVLAARGQSKMLCGDSNGAIEDLNSAIEPSSDRDPRELSAWLDARAQAHLNGQRLVSALNDATEAVRLAPKRASYLLRRAGLHASLAKPIDAAADLEEALSRSPLDCHDTLLGELATHYFNARKYDRAELAFSRAVEDAIARSADSTRVAYLEEMRGAALHFLGRYDDAVEAYNRALAHQPNYGKAYSDRGEALLELGRDEAAFADLERAVANNYRIGCTYVARGTYFQRRAEHDRAICEFDEAARIWPTSAQPLELRARSFDAIGDARRASEDRQRAAVLRATRR